MPDPTQPRGKGSVDPKMTPRPEIPSHIRASFAIAYASQRRTKKLSPALRKAYRFSMDDEIPDIAATREALQAARDIAVVLEEAVRLLESDAPSETAA